MENKITLKMDQIRITRNVNTVSVNTVQSRLKAVPVAVIGEGDHDGGDHGGSDRFTPEFSNLNRYYTEVNGEGSDGGLDGQESDGDDKRF